MASDDFGVCSDTIYDDSIDNNKVSNFFNIPKRLQSGIAFLLSCCIVFGIYKKNESFSHNDRILSDYNIYSGNELVISSDVYDKTVFELEEVLGYDIPEIDEDDLIILDAVCKNANLSDEQKKIFYKFCDFFKDNSFINKEEAYSSLLNVMVLYEDRPEIYNSNIEGVYLYPYKSIGVFVEDSDSKVLVHEYFHCIFSNEYTAYLPSFLKEGVTEILANEYFSDNPYLELSNYPFEVSVVKMLCDVTSPEIVLEAYSTGNMNLIIDYINEFVGDKEVVCNAFDRLNYIIDTFNDNGVDVLVNNRDEILTDILPVFRTCINTKYSDDDVEKKSYYYNELLFSNIFEDDAYGLYYESLLKYGMDRRAYFSSKLINSLGKSNGGITSINEDEMTFKKSYGRVK